MNAFFPFSFSILETQEELENSVKALVTQNNKLVELLEKANVSVPHFDVPKSISFIVTVHDDKTNDKTDQIQNKCTVQQNAAFEKGSDNKSNEVTLNQSNGKQETNATKSTNGIDAETQPKAQMNILPELKEVQSFGSVDLIPVTNTSPPELKLHGKPVNNFVEITPLISKQNEKVPTQSEKACELSQLNQHTNTVPATVQITGYYTNHLHCKLDRSQLKLNSFLSHF